MGLTRILGAFAAAFALAACTRQAPPATAQADAFAPAPKATPAPVAAAPTPAPDLEFIGLAVTAQQTTVVIHDRGTDLRHRINVGQSVAGIEVLGFDETKDQVSVRANGHDLVLGLRAARAEAIPVAEAATTNLPASQLTEAMSAPHLAGATAPGTPAEARALIATALETRTREVEEREARMLVSDLLEISQIQRKAYEEKKAAEEAAARGVQ